MPLRAAFFDVGDTLVEHWEPRHVIDRHARERVCRELGEQRWLDELLSADLEPRWAGSMARAFAMLAKDGPAALEDGRQDTLEWYRAWFRGRGIEPSVDVDRLRSLLAVPLCDISTPVAGAFDAVRWCRDRGLRVVIVSNTLARGDAEALADWTGFGLADAIDGIVTSHGAGWRKPHRAIFERALTVAGVRADEALHVGDNLLADVWGAQHAGLRAVWRRSRRSRLAGAHVDLRDPWSRPATLDPDACDHPAERLVVSDGVVSCVTCGGAAGIEVRPDGIIDDLTELPDLARRWMS